MSDTAISNTVAKYGLMSLKPFHREIARRMALGETQAQIAADTGITPGRLSIIVNSPLFVLEQERLEALRDADALEFKRQMDEEFAAMQSQFNDVVSRAMDSDDITVALQGAGLWAKAAGKGNGGVSVNIQNNLVAPVDLSKYTKPVETLDGGTE